KVSKSERQGLWSPHYLSPSHAFGPFLGPPGFFAAPPGPTFGLCADSGPPGQLCRDVSPGSPPNHGDDEDSSAEGNKWCGPGLARAGRPGCVPGVARARPGPAEAYAARPGLSGRPGPVQCSTDPPTPW
ncbi:hypothetical protein HPB47_016573, partial [Ixodes persulcatus]